MLYRRICDTLAHHSSVINSSKKYGWSKTILLHDKQFICVGHLLNVGLVKCSHKSMDELFHKHQKLICEFVHYSKIYDLKKLRYYLDSAVLFEIFGCGLLSYIFYFENIKLCQTIGIHADFTHKKEQRFHHFNSFLSFCSCGEELEENGLNCWRPERLKLVFLQHQKIFC